MHDLTLHLKGSFAVFAFCVDANLSCVFLGDGGDGERVGASTPLHLILGPGSDGYAVVEPFDVGVRRVDGALENGVLSLHRGHVVGFCG